MKLLVIGNSHAGMLRHAAEGAGTQGPELIFMAREGTGPLSLRPRGSVLAASHKELREALTRLGMPHSVDLQEVDAVILIGMSASVFQLGAMLSRHDVWGWSEADEGRPLLSEPALLAGLRASIEDSLAYRLAIRVRRARRDLPILIVPQPYPSEAILGSEGRFGGIRRLKYRGTGARAAEALDAAHAGVFGQMRDVHLVPRPPEAVVHGCFSHLDFMRDAGRLSLAGRQPDEDILHANRRYGAEVLATVTAMLGARLPRPQATSS